MRVPNDVQKDAIDSIFNVRNPNVKIFIDFLKELREDAINDLDGSHNLNDSQIRSILGGFKNTNYILSLIDLKK